MRLPAPFAKLSVATLSFANGAGNLIGTSLNVSLNPGQSAPLDLNSSVLGLQRGQRIEVQPKITLQVPVNSGSSACGATSEVFDQATGRTWTYQIADIYQ